MIVNTILESIFVLQILFDLNYPTFIRSLYFWQKFQGTIFGLLALIEVVYIKFWTKFIRQRMISMDDSFFVTCLTIQNLMMSSLFSISMVRAGKWLEFGTLQLVLMRQTSNHGNFPTINVFLIQSVLQIAFFRDFRVITTLATVLGLVTVLYVARWFYKEIKEWKESMKPQSIETVSKTVSDPANRNGATTLDLPQQPALQFNNQDFNQQIVNGVFMIMSCTVFLIVLAIIFQILPNNFNESIHKFRPLIGQTCLGTLLSCIFYRNNNSLKTFVWEMYFQ